MLINFLLSRYFYIEIVIRILKKITQKIKNWLDPATPKGRLYMVNLKPSFTALNFSFLQDLVKVVNSICTNERIFVITDTTMTIDINIKLQSNSFLTLIHGEDVNELLRQDEIIIHSDIKIKTTQLLVDLLQKVEFYLKEELSKWINNTDVVVHQIGKIEKKFKSPDNSLTSIKDKITNFLITKKQFY